MIEAQKLRWLNHENYINNLSGGLVIDDHDVDDALLWSVLTDGPWGVIFLVIAVVFTFYACQNADECAKKSCPDGNVPKLMEHACLCVTEAK